MFCAENLETIERIEDAPHRQQKAFLQQLQINIC
jgi:hypothetical protein